MIRHELYERRLGTAFFLAYACLRPQIFRGVDHVPQHGEHEPKPPRPRPGTVAGVVAFVAGGLGTVLAAVTDWGSEAGGLAAARRNHPDYLMAAALFAIGGLVAGAAYTIFRDRRRKSWTSWLLGLGVVLVGIGLALGIISTTKREPGRPNVRIDRLDADSILVTVHGDGWPSNASFDARVDAYDAPGRWLTDLMLARFSPDQSGELNWSERIFLPRSWTVPGQKTKSGKPARARVARVQVNVDKDQTTGTTRECNNSAPTCVYLIVPRRRSTTTTVTSG
jgi:hypothetical protein